MPELRQLVAGEISLFLFGLMGLVATQLLAGHINTRRLLYGRKQDGTLYFSPERAQLLAFTVGIASYYLSEVFANAHPGKLPSLDPSWPAVFGGSNAVYLGGKAYVRFLLRDKSPD